MHRMVLHQVDLALTYRIIMDDPNKLRMILLSNPNLIYHFFHENRVDLVFNFSGELFPPPSHCLSYPCFPSCVCMFLHPYNSYKI